MPVSNIWARGSSESNDGAGRWISHRSRSAKSEASASSGAPHTFQMWPRTWSPTGTCTPCPVLRTGVPRVSPSVGFMQMARTRPSPSCWATSAISVSVVSSRVMSSSSAWLISGSEPRGNSMSMTGPAIATTRPSFSWLSVMVISGRS